MGFPRRELIEYINAVLGNQEGINIAMERGLSPQYVRDLRFYLRRLSNDGKVGEKTRKDVCETLEIVRKYGLV